MKSLAAACITPLATVGSGPDHASVNETGAGRPVGFKTLFG